MLIIPALLQTVGGAVATGAKAVAAGAVKVGSAVAEFAKNPVVQGGLRAINQLESLARFGEGSAPPLPISPATGGPRLALAPAVQRLAQQPISNVGGDGIRPQRFFQSSVEPVARGRFFAERSPAFDRTPTAPPTEVPVRIGGFDATREAIGGGGRAVLNLAQGITGQEVTTAEGKDPNLFQKGLGFVADTTATVLGTTPPSVAAGEADPAPPTGREKFFSGAADISALIQGRAAPSLARAKLQAANAAREEQLELSRKRLRIRLATEMRGQSAEQRAQRGEVRDIRAEGRAQSREGRQRREAEREVLEFVNSLVKDHVAEADKAATPELRAAIFDRLRKEVELVEPGLLDLADFAEANPGFTTGDSFEELAERYPELGFALEAGGPPAVLKRFQSEAFQKRMLQDEDFARFGTIKNKLRGFLPWMEKHHPDRLKQILADGLSESDIAQINDLAPEGPLRSGQGFKLTSAEMGTLLRNINRFSDIIDVEGVISARKREELRVTRPLTRSEANKNDNISIARNAISSTLLATDDPSQPELRRRRNAIERFIRTGRSGSTSKNLIKLFELATSVPFVSGGKEDRQAARDETRDFLLSVGILIPEAIDKKFDIDKPLDAKDAHEILEFTREAYNIPKSVVPEAGVSRVPRSEVLEGGVSRVPDPTAPGTSRRNPTFEPEARPRGLTPDAGNPPPPSLGTTRGQPFTGASFGKQFPRAGKFLSGANPELPSDPSQLVVGDTYQLDDGRIVKFDGEAFTVLNPSNEPSAEETAALVRGER